VKVPVELRGCSSTDGSILKDEKRLTGEGKGG